MTNAILRFVRDEEGATAIEYGVIAGMVTILVVALFSTNGGFGAALNGLYTRLATKLGTAVP